MQKAGLNHRRPTIPSRLETHEAFTTNMPKDGGNNSSAVLHHSYFKAKGNL